MKSCCLKFIHSSLRNAFQQSERILGTTGAMIVQRSYYSNYLICGLNIHIIRLLSFSQILTEEVLASCSSGPRGNQQLRIFALLFYSYLPQ
ncbi:hypothetical protein GLYMA_19G039750v4 [Glycine max]|nr:hypothetical protein GLYMA_19G039750v4 [Glycine max]